MDTGNGIHKSKQPPDATHPFGYGKELYFWSLIVAVLIFGVGVGISTYEGHPAPRSTGSFGRPDLELRCAGDLATVFETFSLIVTFRAFQDIKEEERTIWEAVKTSKDPTIFTVLFEDAAALLGLIVAFVGIFLTHYFNNPYLDGAASVVIGRGIAGFCTQSKGLLVGEGADPQTLESIRKLMEADPGVKKVSNPLTMYFGSTYGLAHGGY